MALQTAQQRDSDDLIDFRERKTFVLGVVQAGIAVLGFVLFFWIAATLHVVAPASFDPDPPSKALSLLFGFVPAILLGAGVPYLIQRRDDFNRLNRKSTVKVVGHALLYGVYFLLFFYDPVSSFVYASTYVGCRVIALGGIFGRARLEALRS